MDIANQSLTIVSVFLREKLGRNLHNTALSPTQKGQLERVQPLRVAIGDSQPIECKSGRLCTIHVFNTALSDVGVAFPKSSHLDRFV